MSLDNIKMSIILSSRDRPEKLRTVIKSLIQNSENCRLIEFLIIIDDDDDVTKVECDNLISSHDKANIRYFIFKRRGYEYLPQNQHEVIIRHLRGELILFWGDDIYMKPTIGWDSILYEEYFKKNFGVYFIPCNHVRSNWKEFGIKNKIDTCTGPFAMPTDFYRKIGVCDNPAWDTWVELISQEACCYYVVHELSSNHDRSHDKLSERSARIRRETNSKAVFQSEYNVKERSRWASVIKDHIRTLNKCNNE
jgi:hypothetical protein